MPDKDFWPDVINCFFIVRVLSLIIISLISRTMTDVDYLWLLLFPVFISLLAWLLYELNCSEMSSGSESTSIIRALGFKVADGFSPLFKIVAGMDMPYINDLGLRSPPLLEAVSELFAFLSF
jgi:hypothetical protein